MRQFYLFQKGQPVADQLTWSHYQILLTLKDSNKINYYINQIKNYNLSKRQLMEKIKFNEYERLDEETKNKLINKEDTNVTDFIKNPILIRNKLSCDIISVKVLKQLILEDISTFMKELCGGYCFIESEMKLIYNLQDLLDTYSEGELNDYIHYNKIV